jgi:hypothetical protein
MSGVDACPEHTERTRRRTLRYCFSFKHHGGSRDAAQWVADLGHDDEFAIFDEADWHDISDDKGNLYGVRRDAALNLEEIGTFGEQIAKFWEADLNVPWHGFPLWHLKGPGPGGRVTEFVSKDVLDRMVQAGLISLRQYNRLKKGNSA